MPSQESQVIPEAMGPRAVGELSLQGPRALVGAEAGGTDTGHSGLARCGAPGAGRGRALGQPQLGGGGRGRRVRAELPSAPAGSELPSAPAGSELWGGSPAAGPGCGAMWWALLGIPQVEEQLDSREVSGGLGEAWGEEGPGQTCAQRARDQPGGHRVRREGLRGRPGEWVEGRRAGGGHSGEGASPGPSARQL